MRFRRGRDRLRTLSIHARLFLGFGGALAACSALMVAIIYVGIRYLPTYDLTTPVKVPPPTSLTPGPTPDTQPPKDLQKGQPLDTSGLIRDKEDVWSTVLLVSIGGVLLVLVVGLGAGWILSRRLLAPLHTINRAAAKASEGDLSYRINAVGPADELKQLADTFDTTLGRLEESFAAHQRFAANASHELLTPLATTRAILQMAGSDPSRDEFAELVPMLRETNERNIRVVQELLQLAVADQAIPDAEPVDLAALAEGVVNATAAEQPDGTDETEGTTGISVTFTTTSTGAAAGSVHGSATLLRQLVINLVDNARTHNVPGGTVQVRVDNRADQVVLEVTNTGPVVAPEVVGRLFEPFYRARPRVASDRTGHGLGLAIVRSIARGHHGTVTAWAQPTGGLRVRVTLPARSRS
ncbi:sensor histidine kinase [Streptomyces sp. WZ-12]|uniref:sensor histidine kinase n=1 Tax=Streptomyces sp. WZ-12 TaxID=3030210 RepID=UPI002380F38C|nr:HAMP domain-containing sensor histidine kinase [Streptomyces sp. WZ-12]